MYRVVKFFTDLQDNNHAYNVGDEFPREGMSVDIDRINLLLSGNNRQGTPLIKEENAVETPKEEIEEPKEEVIDPEGNRRFSFRHDHERDQGTCHRTWL